MLLCWLYAETFDIAPSDMLGSPEVIKKKVLNGELQEKLIKKIRNLKHPGQLHKLISKCLEIPENRLKNLDELKKRFLQA